MTRQEQQRTSERTWHLGRWWPVAMAVFLAVAAARGIFTLDQLIGVEEDFRTGPRAFDVGGDRVASFADYRDTVWIPVRDVLAGGNPYDAPAYLERHPYSFEFSYTPLQLVVFAPLALLPWEASAALWFGALVGAAVLLAAVTVPAAHLPHRLDLVLALAAALLLLRPMALMLHYGQTSMVPLIAAAVVIARRRPDAVTTACVALTWLKPQFAIPVSVLMLTWGLWRSALRGLLLAVAVSVPAVLWVTVNAGGPLELARSLPRALDAALSSPATRPTDYVMPDLSSLLGYLTGDGASMTLLLASMLVVLTLGAVAASRCWPGDPERLEVAYVVAVGTVLLSLPHGSNDLVLAAAALVVAIAAVRGARPSTRWRTIAVCLALALAVLPRGSDDAATRELQLTLGAWAVLALVLLWPDQGSIAGRNEAARRVLATMAGLVVLAGMRYGVDAVLGPDSTARGLLPASALLAAWLLAAAGAARAPTQARIFGRQMASGAA